MKKPKSTNKTNKTVLIIEDDTPILEALADRLAREKFSTLWAKNGVDGLKMALETRPDLILLDILMPKMNGLLMLEKLRAANPWGKKVPVILLTNLSPDETRVVKSVEKTKPTEYLIKSNWSMTEIIKKIHTYLRA